MRGHLLLRLLLPFPAALLGGIVGATVVWIAILLSRGREWMVPGRAVAGGWNLLLNTPWVVVLLTLGFGFGLYLETVLARRM